MVLFSKQFRLFLISLNLFLFLYKTKSMIDLVKIISINHLLFDQNKNKWDNLCLFDLKILNQTDTSFLHGIAEVWEIVKVIFFSESPKNDLKIGICVLMARLDTLTFVHRPHLCMWLHLLYNIFLFIFTICFIRYYIIGFDCYRCCSRMLKKLSFLLFTLWLHKNVFREGTYHTCLIKMCLGKLSSNKIDAYFSMITGININHCSTVLGH